MSDTCSDTGDVFIQVSNASDEWDRVWAVSGDGAQRVLFGLFARGESRGHAVSPGMWWVLAVTESDSCNRSDVMEIDRCDDDFQNWWTCWDHPGTFDAEAFDCDLPAR